jgi:hypothetical protein
MNSKIYFLSRLFFWVGECFLRLGSCCVWGKHIKMCSYDISQYCELHASFSVFVCVLLHMCVNVGLVCVCWCTSMCMASFSVCVCVYWRTSVCLMIQDNSIYICIYSDN